MRYHTGYAGILLITLIAFTPAHAQKKESEAHYNYMHPKLFQARLFGGFNFCQVMGDTYAGYHKVGINAGGMVYAHFNPMFGASLEMLYTQKGVRGANVKESYAAGTYFDKYYLNLNYAETALMLHVDTYVFDYEAGISYAALIKSDEWAEADVPVYIDPKLAYFNSYDIDYIAGLSVRMGKRWAVNMHYQYSITPIRPLYRVPARYSDGSPNERNESITLRLVYKIN